MCKQVGFEHLHRHTCFSLLDGYATVEEYAARSKKIDQHYLCVTDHGMMAAIPRQIKACDKAKEEGYNLKSIYGCELYLNNLHEPDPIKRKAFTPAEAKAHRKSYHLLAIAYNEIGYRNLLKLSTWGFSNGFYIKPRVTHEQLIKHKEGIFFTSCCYIGEIGQAFEKGLQESNGDEKVAGEFAEQMLIKYMSMFGKNFFLEMMMLDFKKQKPYDKWLVAMNVKYKVPTVITQDCHYSEPEDSIQQRYMLMIKNKTTLAAIDKKLSEDDKAEVFELQDQNLWMKSEKELDDKWKSDYQDAIPEDIYIKSKENTRLICERACNIKIDRESKLPKLENDEERFKEALQKGLKFRGFANNQNYIDRMKIESELIVRKGFSSYFLIQKQFIDEAREEYKRVVNFGDGFDAVMPGRGSGCNCLCNFLLGITDVDPIEHGLLFSRFLSESRGGKTIRARFTQKPIN